MRHASHGVSVNGDSFSLYLRDLFCELGRVTLRRMFGGQGIYHDGIIIGLVIGEELFLKTDLVSRDAFAQAGGEPFTYLGKGKPVVMSYWAPPAEALESARSMLPWARLAYEAALRKRGDAGPVPERVKAGPGPRRRKPI